ncbi:hypothetical protein BACERE00183_04313 [Bacillus cereus]|nr:hypothetical protein BACERE00183_04313 [Bacillus cereus]
MPKRLMYLIVFLIGFICTLFVCLYLQSETVFQICPTNLSAYSLQTTL